MLEILLHGYQGTMGKVIASLINQNKNVQLSAGVDRTESKEVLPFPTFTDINKMDMPVDLVIDFSHPDASEGLLDFCVKRKLPLIICTTGLSKIQMEKVATAAKEIPIVYSANMATGVNMVASIIEQIAQPLYDLGFDIEIVESHHNQKVDAPSGTALFWADAAKKHIPEDVVYEYNRHAKLEKRQTAEIGIHSIRGGTIPGEHEIIFAGLDEIITIKHTALSKNIFAVGAVAAAQFIAHQAPGLYSMLDVMNQAT